MVLVSSLKAAAIRWWGSEVGLDTDGVELLDVSLYEPDLAKDCQARPTLSRHSDVRQAERSGVAAMGASCRRPDEGDRFWPVQCCGNS
ncbi:MAG: hypothetical protein ACI8TP_005000 [Acidimicrobiales bacterium]|jgi:hypothetical protein